jgi:hypothetical protein
MGVLYRTMVLGSCDRDDGEPRILNHSTVSPLESCLI